MHLEYSPCFGGTLQPQAQCRRDFEKLQNWDTELVRGLEHRTCKQSLGEWHFSRLKQGWQEEEISDIYTNFWVVVEKVESEVLSGGISSRHKLHLEKFHLYLISNFSVLGVVMHQDNLPKGTESSIPFKTAAGDWAAWSSSEEDFAPLADEVNLLTKGCKRQGHGQDKEVLELKISNPAAFCINVPVSPLTYLFILPVLGGLVCAPVHLYIAQQAGCRWGHNNNITNLFVHNFQISRTCAKEQVKLLYLTQAVLNHS